MGATATKVASPVVQLALLFIVARQGSLADVGRLALGSALAFTCGALAEVGFNTSLSLPKVYLGANTPPLRATRSLRISAAAVGSLAFGALWLAGLGRHDPRFLLLLALPATLALVGGYAGALNASARLHYEGAIALAESVAVIASALALSRWVSPLSAAFLGLVVGRGAGALARLVVVRTLPQSDLRTVPNLRRTQASFVATNAVATIQAQADILVLGFIGSFELLGIYGPLVRTAYSSFLVAEALSWALFSRVNSSGVYPHRGRLQVGGVLLGVLFGLTFLMTARPILEFVLHRDASGASHALALFAVLIPIRFFSFVQAVELVPRGMQAARLPVLAVSSVVLAVGAVAAAELDSLSGLALARLSAEAVLAVGYFQLVRRLQGNRLGALARAGAA